MPLGLVVRRISVFVMIVIILIILLMQIKKPNKPFRVTEDGSVSAPVLVNSRKLRAIGKEGHEYREGVVRRTFEEVHDRFSLHLVELDDQGSLWNRPAFEQTMKCIEAEADANSEAREGCPEPGGPRPIAGYTGPTDGAIIVTYVHGWKHNADVCDADLCCFRDLLDVIAQQEITWATTRSQPRSPRRVIGVYVGWRGLTAYLPAVKELTIWSRKETAHRIGRSSDAMQIISRLTHLRTELHKREVDKVVGSRLLFIGHSLGGALLYTAAASALIDRAYGTPIQTGASLPNKTQWRDEIPGWGDLIVLVNPAFEALLYEGFDQLTRSSEFVARQPTKMVIITSEGDWATHYFFPIGRAVSCVTQMTGALRPQQSGGMLPAVGHYERFRTHTLQLSTPHEGGSSRSHAGPCDCRYDLGDNFRNRIITDLREFRKSIAQSADFPTLRRDQELRLGNVSLKPYRRGLPPTLPYLMIYASKEVIKDHGDIYNPNFLAFLLEYTALQQLILNPALRPDLPVPVPPSPRTFAHQIPHQTGSNKHGKSGMED